MFFVRQRFFWFVYMVYVFLKKKLNENRVFNFVIIRKNVYFL